MNKFEENLKRTYQTWENLIQDIRNISDCENFERNLHQNLNFFDTKLNNKEQFLTKTKFQLNKELIEKNENIYKSNTLQQTGQSNG